MPLSKKQAWSVAVLRAISGNAFITILKFVWFFFTWSGALFSEAIHSVADTANQALLYVWLKKSRKEADENFSYGYWKERFFWAIISACWIFFVWAWVTIYHWIESLFEPHSVENPFLSYTILFIAFLVEWTTLIIALKSVYRKHLGLIKSVKEADNASLAVILEDSVAVIWIFIAFLAIFLSNLTGLLYFDAIWSIIIWILLAIVAVLLIIENKSYLMWRAIDEETKQDIIELIESDPLIKWVVDFKSEVIDVDSYIIKCDAEFNWSSLMREINNNWFLADEYEYLKEDYTDFLKFCVDYADRIPRLIWKNIDALEKNIKDKYPEIKHIDIELN